jgi:superfamily I DNA/RNA helicase
VVLGDDDQSIYSFRYNHPGGITEFKDRWQGDALDDLGIPENRRCGETIVNLANAMMAQAGSRKPPMIPRRPERGALSLVYWNSLGAEISGIARHVRERSDTEFLILVPRRFIGYRLKSAIGRDAATSFHEEVLEVPLVQERFALACYVANPNDSVALRVLLGFDRDGIQHSAKRNAPAYAGVLRQDIVGEDLLLAIAEGRIRAEGVGSGTVRARAASVLKFLRDAPADTPSLLNALFNPELALQIDDEEEREKAKLDLEELGDATTAAHELSREQLRGFLDQLRYRIATRLPLVVAERARVKIMTLHGAKGLEADVVIVAGVADQIIPGLSFGTPAATERKRDEQRRLLYVAVTRAKRELVISWPKLMDYKDATRNQVRTDGGVIRSESKKFVRLGRTSLLPDIPELPRTGLRWLREPSR